MEEGTPSEEMIDLSATRDNAKCQLWSQRRLESRGVSRCLPPTVGQRLAVCLSTSSPDSQGDFQDQKTHSHDHSDDSILAKAVLMTDGHSASGPAPRLPGSNLTTGD